MQKFRMSLAGIRKEEKFMKKAQDLPCLEKSCASVSYVIFNL